LSRKTIIDLPITIVVFVVATLYARDHLPLAGAPLALFALFAPTLTNSLPLRPRWTTVTLHRRQSLIDRAITVIIFPVAIFALGQRLALTSTPLALFTLFAPTLADPFALRPRRTTVTTLRSYIVVDLAVAVVVLPITFLLHRKTLPLTGTPFATLAGLFPRLTVPRTEIGAIAFVGASR